MFKIHLDRYMHREGLEGIWATHRQVGLVDGGMLVGVASWVKGPISILHDLD